ncbi:MAG: type II toxin-antitoxin system VapC family toxin [Bifidobacteriaceae bacterium]|jgi:predicted nucleic acid-binding protein|nr:type II toxin-antitoxin system VapC family toxin [Bifidobacteriaceae bacterium]
MKFLLDTDVLSEARRRRGDPGVRAWLNAQVASDLAVSVITILELERGILGVGRRDPAQGAVLKAWLEDRVLDVFAGRILAVDLECARTLAILDVPDRLPERDGIIAATGIVHGLTVVTRNVRDLERTGVPLLDPWG